MDKSTIQLHPSWLEHLKEEFQKDYMLILKKKLLELKNKKITFYLLKLFQFYLNPIFFLFILQKFACHR